jgi:hypothetical protein
VDYRKELLVIAEVLIRENIERRFTTGVQDKLLKELDLSKFGLDLTEAQMETYLKFVKERVDRISREIYEASIDATLSTIVKELGSVFLVFTDDEVKQLYDLSKSSLGRKIIRNLDIVQDAFSQGMIHMGHAMMEKFSDPTSMDEISDFVEKLVDEANNNETPEE